MKKRVKNRNRKKDILWRDTYFEIDDSFSIKKAKIVLRNVVVEEVLEEAIYHPRKKMDTSIGVLFGPKDNCAMVKLRSGTYIDCDNVACEDWGRYAFFSLDTFKKCEGYAPPKQGQRKSYFRFGETLRLYHPSNKK